MWSKTKEQYAQDRKDIISKTEGVTMTNKTNHKILFFVLTVMILIGSVYSVFAQDIDAPYAISNATQIQKGGHHYQIKGIKPNPQNEIEGGLWLADASEAKAMLNNKDTFRLVECVEVLLNRHQCEDIVFSDGDSVKSAVLERGYAVNKQ
jgi:hypothetical protein